MLCNLVERLAQRGISNIVVSTTSSIGENSLRPRIEQSAEFVDLDSASLLSPRFLSAFHALLKREKPDIVQTWMHTAGMSAGFLARMLGLHHVVWGIHSKDLLRFEDKPGIRLLFGRLLGLGAFFFPQKIISCSQAGIDIHHRKYGYPTRKMVWIGNGVDTDRFHPDPAHGLEWRTKLGIPSTAPVIGMVARFHPVKDIPTFVRAASLLQKSRKDVHFVFCGGSLDGKAPADIVEAASELTDPSRFHWLGIQSQTEKVYPLLDILTVTSVSEAYPMVLIEAMASGVPCVSTDVGDASLILGELGKVVPVQKPESIAQAWESLLNLPPEKMAALRSRVREYAAREFGLDTCASKYEAIYQELVSR